jgi:hypothetical protein
LHHFVPRPTIPVVSPKLAWFLAHKDEYDAVFIGSSRVCHGVIPAEFDQVMKEHGLSCRSFNLGVEQMFPPATFQLLDTVLQAKPAHLKWVFLELAPIYTTDNEPTLRAIAWHDGPATALVIKDLAREHGWWGLLRHAADIFANLRLFLLNATNVGRVPTLLRPEPDEAGAATEFAGYMPLHGTNFGSEKMAKKYEAALAAMRAAQPLPEEPLPVSARAFAQQLQLIERSGAKPLLFILPLPRSTGDFLDAKTPHSIFAFNDLDRYATFYDLANRYDGGHLNDKGARLFTHTLAGLFADSLHPVTAVEPAH